VAKTDIEWATDVWNPIAGCTQLSPGCDRCYAKTFAERFCGVAGHPYEHGFDLVLHPERLEAPLHWRNPRRIFVNSMSDLFHADIPDVFIRRVFDVMRAADWHTFLVLTKRPRRMAELALDWPEHVWAGTSVELDRYAWRANHYLSQVSAHIRFVSAEPGWLGSIYAGEGATTRSPLSSCLNRPSTSCAPKAGGWPRVAVWARGR
jgi:protein gp37